MRPRTAWVRWYAPVCLLLITTLLACTGANSPALAAPNAQTGGLAAVGDHLVTNISLSPVAPNLLANNQNVTLAFTYSTTEVGGVRIFARPFTNGALSPNYAAHGSPLYPQSAGNSASGSFTITTGQVVVDQIHLQMWNDAQSTLLFETFIPVYYLFHPAPDFITNLSLNVPTSNVLAFNQNVNATFTYSTTQANGVLIFLRPFTKGSLTPNYAASGSSTYSGTGEGTGSFTISTEDVVVDQIHIQILDTRQSALLFEAFVPVYYHFRAATNSVTSIALSPATPNVFTYTRDINLTFNYTTTLRAGGARIFIQPFSGANLAANYAASGSPLYPAGSGSGTASFNLTAGPLVVDSLRIQMWDDAQTTLLAEDFLPVYLDWAGASLPPGPDLRVDGLEVTQAIQDLNNSVDLVAGKHTYVRVHASAPVNTSAVFATLTGSRGGVTLVPTLNPGNPGTTITLRPSPNREQLNDSFWFELPASWTTAGGLTLTAKLDPYNGKNDLAPSNNVATVTVNFKSTPALRLRLMNVQYTVGGTTYLANTSHMVALESWLRRAYPIASLQVTRQTLIYPTNGLPDVDTLNGLMAMSKLLRTIFSGEDARVVYYGMVDDGGGFMRGKAAGIPGTIAAGPTGSDNWGWDLDGSYGDWYGGHEIGHTRGRYHAEFCGAGDGANYPYTGGRISPVLTGNSAIYGFDITTRAIYGPSWKDVMTYCANEWVSDFTYEGILSHMVTVGMVNGPQLSATASQFLAVSGSADLTSKTASLTQVALIQQSNTLSLPEPGDWTLALVSAANVDLATYPFAPDELSDAESSPGTPAIIAEVVPWSAGAVRVEIRYNGLVVATRSASANAPSVSLTAPTAGSTLPSGPFPVTWTGTDADGDTLSYSLLYSTDGGATWQTLATNVAGTSLELNTDQLPGGSGLLRVVASDGFLSAQATSGALTVPRHAPTGQIVLPTANQIFYPTQHVTLQASGYDMEDGTLGDAAFAWASSLDGVLGSGANLSTAGLATGTHVITLTVTDSDLQTSTVTRTLTVVQENTPVVSALGVAPFAMGLAVSFKSAAVQQALSLRSSSGTEFGWTASEALAWVTLDVSSGQTPAELTLTIDPTGLTIGTHTGVIIFTSTLTGSRPITIPLNVQITGEKVYLPLVQKPG